MTDSTNERRRYSSDETGEIIRRATALSQRQDDGGLSYDELVEVAAEVGIDQASVDEAVRQAEQETAEERARNAQPPAWRSVADRCLTILCLKPHSR